MFQILKTINKYFYQQMKRRQTKANISNVILSSISQNLISGSSKLAQLQHIYTSNGLGFQDLASPLGRILTKKIFGAAVKCLNSNQQQTLFVNSKNLVALSFVMLLVGFEDQYAIREIIKEINECEYEIEKMFKIYNPYKNLNMSAKDFQKVLVQIILKINSWNVLVNIYNNLQQYSVATETFSIFLRAFLAKLDYQNSRNLSKNLQNTQQIYSIICDYFGLNVISHRANSLRKRNNIRHQQQQQLGQKAIVYLFNNNNLFISTVDGLEYCCGRYYSNQTQLEQNQDELSRSTLQYMFKCKKAQEKQVEEENQENEDKFEIMRVSQLQLDLGMSTSGFCLSQGQTPFFPNNEQTPEFGNMIQFRKSMDFESAQKLIQKDQPSHEIIQQESNQDRFVNTQTYTSRIQQQSDEQQDINQKPRSPPSTQSRNKSRTNVKNTKKYQQQRENKKQKYEQIYLTIPERKKQTMPIKLLKSIPIQSSQSFIRNEPVQKLNPPSAKKKKKQSIRKYSVNEIFTSQLKDSGKNKQKNIIHHSNHFNRTNENQEYMAQSGKNHYKEPSIRQASNIWENDNCRSQNMIGNKKNQRKMEFTSNIINIHVNSSKDLLNYIKQDEQINIQQVKYKLSKTKPNKKFIDVNQKINKLKNFHHGHQNSPRTENNTYTFQGSSVNGYSNRNKNQLYETYSSYQLRNEANNKNYDHNTKSPGKIEKKCPQFLKSPKQRKPVFGGFPQKKISNKSIKKFQVNNKQQKAEHDLKVLQLNKRKYNSTLENSPKINQQFQNKDQVPNVEYNMQNFSSPYKMKTQPIIQHEESVSNLYRNIKHTQSDSNLYPNMISNPNTNPNPIPNPNPYPYSSPINYSTNLSDNKNDYGCKPWIYFGKTPQNDTKKFNNVYPSFQYGLSMPTINQNKPQQIPHQTLFRNNIETPYYEVKNIYQGNHTAQNQGNKIMSDYRIRQEAQHSPIINHMPGSPVSHRNHQIKYVQPVSPQIQGRMGQNNFYLNQNNLLSCERQKYNTAASSTVFSPSIINPNPQTFYQYQKAFKNPYLIPNSNIKLGKYQTHTKYP